MKRNTFVKSCFALGAILTAPVSLAAKAINKYRVNAGFMVGAGKSRNGGGISLFEGDTFYTKVSPKDTEGDIYVFESSRIKEGGPSYHYHFTQDEWWYVLQGEFLFKVGDVMYNAKAGDSIFGPRMVPHSFAKVGKEEGKLLMFFQPAGKMEEFFTKLSEGKGKNMTEEEKDNFMVEYGFKRVGPPLNDTKKW